MKHRKAQVTQSRGKATRWLISSSSCLQFQTNKTHQTLTSKKQGKLKYRQFSTCSLPEDTVLYKN